MTQVNQNNFPIPNDTGANVLADINENLTALQSLNAGDSNPAVGNAHQPWVDTSTSPDTLKIKDAANNNFITLGTIETDMGMMKKTGGTFTGNIRSSSGSESSPGIQVGDSNTGFYLSSANVVSITCNGNASSHITQDGVTVANNKRLFLANTNNASIGLRCQSSLSASWTLELPNNDGNAGEVLSTNGSGVTDWIAIQGVPTGSILAWAGADGNSIPAGYFECDGSTHSSTTYPALAAVCAAFSAGLSGQFRVPDLRGRFIRGWDHGANIDKTANRTRGSEQLDRNKRHFHSSSYSVSTTGGNHSHPIRRIRLNENNGAVDITLGSGQSYNVGYSNNDGALVSAGSAVKDSGNLSLSSSMSLTIHNDPIATADDESRPRNIALIYIIKN